MKKTLSLLIVLSLLLSSGTITMAKDMHKDYSLTNGYNYTTINSMSRLKLEKKFNDNVLIIEKYIEDKGTSVLEELNKEKQRLKIILEQEEDLESIKKLEKLIANYTKSINEHIIYKENSYHENSDIVINGISHPILSPAVSTIISYFSMNQYYLSAELLMYAKEDSDGSEYEPFFGTRIYDTTDYKRLQNQIRYSGKTYGSGSSNFEKGNKIIDNDLYYAIHAYNYSYNQGRLAISDIYDYDVNEDYEGIAGTAINTMYMAQVLGVIVPFDVIIELNY